MARGFTDAEKKNIREKLIAECEKSWASLGYKKTSIDELCTKVGIAKGSFYLFFDSKELLFCAVSDTMQQRQVAQLEETLSKSPSKSELCQLLKKIYLGYDEANIFVQRTSPDFAAFWNRAPIEWIKKYQKNSDDFINKTILSPHLKLKMEKEKALGIINALLGILTYKNMLGYNHYEVFCTLLDNIINEIYE